MLNFLDKVTAPVVVVLICAWEFIETLNSWRRKK